MKKSSRSKPVTFGISSAAAKHQSASASYVKFFSVLFPLIGHVTRFNGFSESRKDLSGLSQRIAFRLWMPTSRAASAMW